MDISFQGLPGSNLRREEEDVAWSWNYFIRAVEAGRAQIDVDGVKLTVSTNDILMWLTGASMRPAVGLPSKVDVYFERGRVLPYVSTCGPVLKLPICSGTMGGRMSVDTFTRWILDSPGFGQV